MASLTSYRRPRRRRETPPPSRVLLQAAVATAVVLGLVWLALSIYGGAPWKSFKTIYATVPDTGNLQPHQPIRINGVNVGQVIAIGVTEGGEAKLKLQIDSNVSLPTGTTFTLRADGLLGSRYVQLIPGHGATQLADGTTLHGNVDTLTYGVPDALDVLNEETRGNLGDMINGLGEGLLGRGLGLNEDIHLISVDSVPAQHLLQAIAGANLQQLIPSLDRLTAPLDAARVQITDLLGPLAKALEPFVTERPDVQATLTDLPPALTAATQGLGNGQRLLTAATSLASAAEGVLPDAPSGLEQTTLLLKDSHPALISARTLLVDAKPAVPALLRLTRSASPLLTPLHDGLLLADPILNTVAPYGCNIENTATTLRSMTGFGGTEAGGPAGPPMAFRLEVDLAPPTEILGTKDYTGLVQRQGYAAPCTDLSTSYPITTDPTSGLNR